MGGMSTGPNPYLRTKIMTASPEELRLMLYDGAIRYCRQAAEALDQQQFEASYNGLMRAQKIVLELSTSLDPKVAPELCEKLGALYTYLYRLLVDANLEKSAKPVRECIKLLEFERETWRLLMSQLADSPDRSAPDRIEPAQQTAISSLSVDG